MSFFSNVSSFIFNRLKKNPKKSISTLCYKIGVFSTTVALSFTICAALIMNGFHANIEDRIISLCGDINITSNNFNAEKQSFDIRLLESINPETYQEIDAIKHASFKIVLLEHNNEFKGITLYGLDNTAKHDNIKQYICKGKLPILSTSTHCNEIVVSSTLAKQLNLHIGDTIVLSVPKNPPSYRNVIIKGIYNSCFPDFDEKFVFCDIRFIQKLNGSSNTIANSLNIFLKHKKDSTKVAKYLNKTINPKLHALTIQDTYYDIFEWISVLYKNTIIFIILLIVMINTNLIAIISIQVIDQLYMISILKYLGARIKQLMEIFTRGSLQMVIIGMLYGNILGLSLCSLQYYTRFIKLNSSIHYIDYVPIYWHWPLIFIINLTILSTTIVVLVVTQIIILKTKLIDKR